MKNVLLVALLVLASSCADGHHYALSLPTRPCPSPSPSPRPSPLPSPCPHHR